MRAAYATCLLADGTSNLMKMLGTEDGFLAFCECLYNGLSFDVDRVSEGVLNRVGLPGKMPQVRAEPGLMFVRLPEDFFAFASETFLRALIAAAARWHGGGQDAIALYALSELHRRAIRLPRTALAADAQTYLANMPNRKITVVRRPRIWSQAATRYEFHIRDVVKLAPQ